MHARDLLLQRQKELKDSIETVQVELSQISRAIRAMDEKPTEIGQFPPKRDTSPPSAPTPIKHVMRVNDAIVIAVEAGHRTPTQILAYLKSELGVETTLNSVRSRVSPLGQRGVIGHDGSGWVPAQTAPNENEALATLPLSAPEAGEVTASPNDNQAVRNDLLG